MPPRVKGGTGKDGAGPNGGAEKGLAYFQDFYEKYKAQPDQVMRKGGDLSNLERLSNEGSRLARLCRLRIQFEAAGPSGKAWDSVNNAAGSLTKLINPPRISLTAACLLAEWYTTDGKNGGADKASIWENLKALFDRLPEPHGNEHLYEDPAEEEIVRDEACKLGFESLKDADSKLARLQRLHDYLRKKHKKADRGIQHKQKQAQGDADDTSKFLGDYVRNRDARQQQNPAVNEQIQRNKEHVKMCNTISSTEATAEEVEKERDGILKKLAEALRNAGNEGSPDRVSWLCALFAVKLPDYENALKDAIHKWTLEHASGIAVVENFYQQQLATQLQRLRSYGRFAVLELPDIIELMDSSALDLLGKAKDDKGQAKGAGNVGRKANTAGGGREGGKGKGGTGGGGDVPAVLVTVPAFLNAFSNALQEHGKVVISKMFERGKDVIVQTADGVTSAEEMGALSAYVEFAPALAEVLQLRQPSPFDVKPPGSLLPRLVHEVVGQLLMGEQMVVEILNANRDPVNDLQGVIRQRLQFTAKLPELTVLQRFDVMGSIATRYCILSGVNTGEGPPEAASCSLDLPFSPKDVLECLGDPLLLLQGYAWVLRHRRLLPLKHYGKVPPDAHLDAAGARLARLCDHVLAHGEDASEPYIMAMCIHGSHKKEHVEILQRLYGEMPTELANGIRERQRKEAEATAAAAANGDVSHTAAPEAGADAPAAAPAPAADADANGPGDGDGFPFFGPWLSFEIRDDLPEWERDEVKRQWRQDILDAIEVMETGGCGLGRRTSATIAGFISQALKDNTRPRDIQVTAAGLLPKLEKLETEPLVHLRLFVLSQLGCRAGGTLLGLEEKLESIEVSCRAQLWAVELTQPEGDMLQLSRAAYDNMCEAVWHKRLRNNIKLRVAHAVKRVLEERNLILPPPSAADFAAAEKLNADDSPAEASGAAAGAVPATAAGSGGAGGGGGGKKKGKGGAAAAPAATNAAVPQVRRMEYSLPPLPAGTPPLEGVEPRALLESYGQVPLFSSGCTETALYHDVVQYRDPLCSQEILEHLQLVLDPPEYDMEPGTEPAEAAVIEEVCGSATFSPELVDSVPVFTLRDVVMELVTGSLLEALWQRNLLELQGQTTVFLENWAGYMQDLAAAPETKETRDEVMSTVKDSVSDWAFKALQRAAGAVEVQLKGAAAMGDWLCELDRLRASTLSGALMLQARHVRFAAIRHAVRLQETIAVEAALTDKINEISQITEAPAKTDGGDQTSNKQAGKKNNAPRLKDAVARKTTDLEDERKLARDEATFLRSCCNPKGYILGAANVEAYRAYRISKRDSESVRMYDPREAAHLIVEALEALQLYAFHLAVLEATVEGIQLQARMALRDSLINAPVLQFGVSGLHMPRTWLREKLRLKASDVAAQAVLVEATQENLRKKQEEDAKARALREQREREQQKKDEERRKAKEAEERRVAEAQKARALREKEEQEEAARKKEAEEEKQRQLRATTNAYMVNLSELNEDVPEVKAPPAAPTLAPQKAGHGHGHGHGQGHWNGQQPATGHAAAYEAASSGPLPRTDYLRARLASPQRSQAGGRRDAALAAGQGAQAGGPPGGGGGRAAPPAGAPGAASSGRGAASVEGAGGRKGFGPPQQHQQQRGGGPPVGKDVGSAAGYGGAGAAGRDAGGKGGQGAAVGGRGDRGGGSQQPPGGKGGAGGRGGTGGGAAGGPAGGKPGGPAAVSQPPKPAVVPGFDPDLLPGDVKSKGRRGRRGGGGGGGGGQADAAPPAAGLPGQSHAPAPPPAAAAGFNVAAAGNAAASGCGDEAYGQEEHPHPPATMQEESEVLADLVTEGEPASGEYEALMAQFPFVHPYPLPPPPAWHVHDGFLFPDGIDPEREIEASLKDNPSACGTEESLANYRRLFMIHMAKGIMEERGYPNVPPEARKDRVCGMPYAVPAEVPQDFAAAQPPALAPVGGMPHLGGFAPQPPPFPPAGAPTGPPYLPGGLPPYSGIPPHLSGAPLPPHLAAFPRPPVVGPFPGGMPPPPFMPGMSYGPPGLVRPPGPGMTGQAPMAPPPDASAEDDDDDDNDDLLGLLGVQAQPSRTAAAPPPVAAPLPVYPPYTPGPPGYGAFGAPPPAGALPPYSAAPPPMMPATPVPAAAGVMSLEMEDEEVSPPSVAGLPYMSPGGPHQLRPSAAPAPAPLQTKSWAQAAASGGKAPANRPAPKPHDHEDGDVPDTEEKQLQAALHRSMRDNMNVAFPPLGGVAAAAAAAAAAATSGRHAPPSAAGGGGQELALVSVAGTGLVNRVGEYNCFLNVIIQCLWHCDAFRRQMSRFAPDDFAAEHPVVAALLRLFRALDAAEAVREQQRQQLARSGGVETAPERHVVDPSELREALDAQGVRAGEMNDASEVLGALFESLNRAPALLGTAGGGDPASLSLVDRTFGLLLSEEVRCTVATCRRITHVVPQHVEYFMIIAATGLRDMLAAIDCAGVKVSMGRIIHEIEAQNIKRCDNDPPHHGCNTPTRVTRTLLNVPAVFTVQLAWEPEVPADAIAGTLALVDTVLSPQEIFNNGNCPADLPSYALHGMFCYYGQHYFAFINRGPVEPESRQEWVMFDDATVAAVGSWDKVIIKCRAGRIQPSVLFYQQYAGAGRGGAATH